MGIAAAVAERIRALRTAQGLTQAELAVRMGMAESSVSRIENGGRSASLETIERFAHALGVHVGEIVGSNMVDGPRSDDAHMRRLGRVLAEQPPRVRDAAVAIVELLVASQPPHA